MSMTDMELSDGMRQDIGDLLRHAAHIIQQVGTTIPDNWGYDQVRWLIDEASNVGSRAHNMTRPRGWLCIAETRSKCGKAAPIDTEAHEDCGEFFLDKARRI